MAQQLFNQRYKTPTYISRGSFGVVASVQVTDAEESRAMKLIESSDRTAMKEVQMLCPSYRQHENIVRYFDTWILNTESLSSEWNSVLQVKYRQNIPPLMFAIELELCEADLATILGTRNLLDTANIPESTHDSLIKCMKDVSKGLKFLHGQRALDGRPSPVVHRDIKPANILRHKNGTWKISDLGLARLVDTTMTPGAGSPFYFAPEQGTQNYDEKVDIFSFGLVLFEICYRMKDQQHRYQCFRGIRSSRFVYPPPSTERFDYYSILLDNLIRGMLIKDPRRRASIGDVISYLEMHLPAATPGSLAQPLSPEASVGEPSTSVRDGGDADEQVQDSTQRPKENIFSRMATTTK